MDENKQGSDDYPEVESEIDDLQWRYQTRSSKRGNKAPRTDSFVQGRTITSSSRGNGRMEKNITRHISSQQEERKNEKKNDNQQLSNLDNGQYVSTNDIQYLCIKNGDKKSSKTYERGTGLQQSNSDVLEQIYVSHHALKFAVEDRLPPLKIQCDPALTNQDDALLIAKGYLNHIEKNFRKLNPRYNNPLGFDHYMIDSNGALICFTKSMELFIYMCNINNYPEDINNRKIRPILPTKLPARNAIILKFIDNKIKFEDIQIVVKEKMKSVYSIEEMLGTITYRSRHIRVDLLSNEEYIGILNSGKFVIGGHLYEVDEYLPSPKILICNKCNTPGHMKKNCKSAIDVCKRCGNDRNDGVDHKGCNIKCHHCGGDHEATNFKCTTISKFRQELLRQLKNNTHLLPPHIQFYIPQQFRDQKSNKFLMNNNNEMYQVGTRRDDLININPQDFNVWPALNSNSALPAAASSTSIWNSELRKLQDELHNLKREHENEIKQIKMECDNQIQKMVQGWQLINLQIKTQAEAISDVYTTVSETLPVIIQSIQTINYVMKEMNGNTINDNERQAKENMFTTINDTINTFNNRLLLLTNHQQKLKTLMDKQNELLLRGMNSIDQLSNEL
ncbi:unnamed protein product [Rotaria sp. Silwood2]|nr:unnamed protein product [Rotaria sp. Silwood2]CAF3266246.1 unnamed protein product [Rotaria sp. Silwood2]CAF4130523.1 unnamed protein product [Rotaria sp. Silwood2]CAF4228457.1 unnamed protein product [Rotaria sp. Silwood2]